MVHVGLSQKMVCQRLVSDGVWLERDELGPGLPTQPGRGRRNALQVARERWTRRWRNDIKTRFYLALSIDENIRFIDKTFRLETSILG